MPPPLPALIVFRSNPVADKDGDWHPSCDFVGGALMGRWRLTYSVAEMGACTRRTALIPAPAEHCPPPAHMAEPDAPVDACHDTPVGCAVPGRRRRGAASVAASVTPNAGVRTVRRPAAAAVPGRWGHTR